MSEQSASLSPSTRYSSACRRSRSRHIRTNADTSFRSRRMPSTASPSAAKASAGDRFGATDTAASSVPCSTMSDSTDAASLASTSRSNRTVAGGDSPAIRTTSAAGRNLDSTGSSPVSGVAGSSLKGLVPPAGSGIIPQVGHRHRNTVAPAPRAQQWGLRSLLGRQPPHNPGPCETETRRDFWSKPALLPTRAAPIGYDLRAGRDTARHRALRQVLAQQWPANATAAEVSRRRVR